MHKYAHAHAQNQSVMPCSAPRKISGKEGGRKFFIIATTRAESFLHSRVVSKAKAQQVWVGCDAD